METEGKEKPKKEATKKEKIEEEKKKVEKKEEKEEPKKQEPHQEPAEPKAKKKKGIPKIKIVPPKQKAIRKAKKTSKAQKEGTRKKRHRIYQAINKVNKSIKVTRFFRPITEKIDRKPKFEKTAKAAFKLPTTIDKYAILKNPLSTEKAMKKMEEENTMVFLVDPRANKTLIKEAFFKLYNMKARRVNTMIRPDGKKKAFIKLANDNDSLNLANKIGII